MTWALRAVTEQKRASNLYVHLTIFKTASILVVKIENKKWTLLKRELVRSQEVVRSFEKQQETLMKCIQPKREVHSADDSVRQKGCFRLWKFVAECNLVSKNTVWIRMTFFFFNGEFTICCNPHFFVILRKTRFTFAILIVVTRLFNFYSWTSCFGLKAISHCLTLKIAGGERLRWMEIYRNQVNTRGKTLVDFARKTRRWNRSVKTCLSLWQFISPIFEGIWRFYTADRITSASPGV